MKNILIYLPALFLLFGCEDFLNRAAYDQMDSENFYRNAEEINAAVMACYNGIHGTLNNEFFLTEVRSDNTRHEGQGSTTGTSLEIANLDLFKVEPSNTINNAYWEKAYHNIANCNTVLGHSQVVTNVTLREQYDAEARFIRAYHYFNLVRLYGPLFLVTERITAEEAKNYERSTVDAVYRLIIDDLDYASRKLPVKYDSSNIGRVDQWGAKTLLGKVYLTLSKNGMDKEMLTQAKLLLEDVEKNSGYGLVTSSYADVFSISNEMNKEMIFVSRYLSGGHGLGSPFANYFAPVNSENMILTGSGNGYNCPTEDLISTYNSEAGETRKDVILKEFWIDQKGATQYVSYVTKYLSPVTVRYDAENDWPILRFADVLLMLGEIENEFNGPTQNALDYINATRLRAGLKKVEEVQPITTKSEYRTAMAKERRLEFALENHRLFDLLRTEQLINVMRKHYTTEQMRNKSTGALTDYYANEKTPVYVKDPLLENWQLLLPIPYNVIITAPNATQNSGYSGV